MKPTHIVLVALIVCMLTFSCKNRPSVHNDKEPTYSTLMNDASSPTEEEIGIIMDTAVQEKTTEIREELKGLHIYVSKTTMHLYVLDKNDSVLFSCSIACGLRKGNKQEKGDYKTPEGDFIISGLYNSTDWIHHTKDGRNVKGCYGPHFLRLSTGRFGGIGIHGTNAPRSIGKRASEGCIRVNSKNIITLFNQYAYKGMRVVVGAEDEPLPIFKGFEQPQTKEEKNDTTTTKDAEHTQINLKNNIKETKSETSEPTQDNSVKVNEIDSLFS